MIPKDEERESSLTKTTHDTHDVSSGSQQASEGNGESESLLLAGKSTTTPATAAAIAGTNYMYDPFMRTWSHHNQQPQPQQQQTNYTQLSRRQSEQSQFTRRDSFANTLYLTDDQTQFNHLLTNTRSTTSMMALDAQIEANQELLLQRQESYPSLGLVLSYIPSIDTSLSAFALLGQQSEGQQQQQHEDNMSIIIPDKSILKSLHVCTFMTSILLYGIAHSMISQFLFLLLKDLGMSSSTMGWTGPIGGAAEMMTFWISRQVIMLFYFCVLHYYVSIVKLSAFL